MGACRRRICGVPGIHGARRWNRDGADFRHYLMFSVLPVNIIALIVAAVRGAAEYKTWSAGTLIYVYNPLYPIGIAVGTIWITLAFIAINRLTRREA